MASWTYLNVYNNDGSYLSGTELINIVPSYATVNGGTINFYATSGSIIWNYTPTFEFAGINSVANATTVLDSVAAIDDLDGYALNVYIVLEVEVEKNINKVVYNGETLLDLTSDTVSEESLLEGATAHDKSGRSISGSLTLPTYSLAKDGNRIVLNKDGVEDSAVEDNDTTYNNATTSEDGLMSSTDKLKLNGINLYTSATEPENAPVGSWWIDTDEVTPSNITPETIGAIPITRKINNKQLNTDITLTAADVGAAPVGYGLGDYSINLTEIPSSTKSSFVTFDTSDGARNGFLSVRNDSFQSIVAVGTDNKLYLRNKLNGAWNDWINYDSRFAPAGYGAGAHNAIYRGANLGAAVTDAQWAAIKAGTFEDMYIGDYWVIGGVTYRIAAFNYYYNTGDTACTKNHITIVPDSNMYTHRMNDTDITTGAYVGSKMYTEGLSQAKTTINAAFGEAHILNHRQYLQNAVTNGKPSGGSWYDSTVELMTEQNAYGGKVFGVGNDGSTIPNLYAVDRSQYPLFRFRPDMQSNRQWFWLRDVVFAAYFAAVTTDGLAACYKASHVGGVRPAFSIY